MRDFAVAIIRAVKRNQPELPEVNFSDYGDIRYLHLGTEWIQGSMRMDDPLDARSMVERGEQIRSRT